MLTYEDLPLSQDTFQALLEHLRGRGKAMSPQKIQGPGTTVKFPRVVLLGQTGVDPGPVTDKMQAYPASKIMKEVRPIVRMLGFTEDLYSPPGAVPPSLISHVGLGIRAAGCLREGGNTREAD